MSVRLSALSSVQFSLTPQLIFALANCCCHLVNRNEELRGQWTPPHTVYFIRVTTVRIVYSQFSVREVVSAKARATPNVVFPSPDWDIISDAAKVQHTSSVIQC